MCSDYIAFNYIHHLLAQFQGSQRDYDHYADHYYNFLSQIKKELCPKNTCKSLMSKVFYLT